MPRRLPPHPRERDETVRPSVETTPAAAPESKQSTLAGEVLRLQRLVGNTAVTSLIARSPLQRDEAAPAEAAPAKGGEEEKGSSYTMTMSGVGSFPLESLSWGVGSPGARGREEKDEEKEKEKEKGKEREGAGKAAPTELHATKPADDVSAKLMQKAAKGDKIDTVEIVLRKGSKAYLTIRLKNVFISGYQTGGGGGGDKPHDTFSLNAESAEFEYKPDESGGGGGGY